MPTPSKRPRPVPVEVPAIQPSAARKPRLSLEGLVESVRQRVRDEVESQFDAFMDSASSEDMRILFGILNDHASSAVRGDRGRPLARREVPGLLAAILNQVNNTFAAYVEVRDEKLLAAAERCMVELERKSYQIKTAPKSDLDARLQAELALFSEESGEFSKEYLLRVIARWNELRRDPNVRAALNDEGESLFEAAFEIEYGRRVAEHAAKNAIAA